MAESGQERTEEATQRRKSEARKHGQVPKSIDLTNALVMIAMLMVLPGAVLSLGENLILAIRSCFQSIPHDSSPTHLMAFAQSIARPLGMPVLEIIGTCMVCGVVGTLAQIGFLVTPDALVPKPQKLNPMNGIKRLFSPVSVFDGGKAFIKTFIFGWMAYIVLRDNYDKVVGIWQVPAVVGLSVAGQILRSVAMRIISVWAVLAGLDYFFQRKQWEKNLRMTKEEIKQEFKDSEGNPEFKAARMGRMRRMARQRGKKVPIKEADVVVTNPTHFAVAIKYQMGKDAAPIVIAKGADLQAFAIREEAKAAGVPIVPNPPLARALYKACEVGDFVPKDLFANVAEVLAYVYRTLKRARR